MITSSGQSMVDPEEDKDGACIEMKKMTHKNKYSYLYLPEQFRNRRRQNHKRSHYA